MKKAKIKITAVAESGKAYIKITDRISEYSENGSAAAVKSIIDPLIGQGIKQADVYINSQGGSVFQATEIVNELKRFEKVNLTVGALAASAATYLVAKYPTSAFSNSQFMIHKPMLSSFGNINQITSDLKLLKNITSDYLQAYATKTGKTEAEIEELWKDGDYWMTAQEANNLGLIDSVIESEEAVTSESIAVLEACGAPVIPPPVEKPTEQNNNMDRKLLIASLGLSADATDDQITQKISDNKEKAEKAEQLQADAERSAEVNAEALATQGVLEKKYPADKKEQYKKLALANYEAAKAVIESMPTIQALSHQLNPVPPTGIDTSRAAWGLEDWIEKDPKGLSRMETENPEAFLKLNTDHYGI